MCTESARYNDDSFLSSETFRHDLEPHLTWGLGNQGPIGEVEKGLALSPHLISLLRLPKVGNK